MDNEEKYKNYFLYNVYDLFEPLKIISTYSLDDLKKIDIEVYVHFYKNLYNTGFVTYIKRNNFFGKNLLIEKKKMYPQTIQSNIEKQFFNDKFIFYSKDHSSRLTYFLNEWKLEQVIDSLEELKHELNYFYEKFIENPKLDVVEKQVKDIRGNVIGSEKVERKKNMFFNYKNEPYELHISNEQIFNNDNFVNFYKNILQSDFSFYYIAIIDKTDKIYTEKLFVKNTFDEISKKTKLSVDEIKFLLLNKKFIQTDEFNYHLISFFDKDDSFEKLKKNTTELFSIRDSNNVYSLPSFEFVNNDFKIDYPKKMDIFKNSILEDGDYIYKRKLNTKFLQDANLPTDIKDTLIFFEFDKKTLKIKFIYQAIELLYKNKSIYEKFNSLFENTNENYNYIIENNSIFVGKKFCFFTRKNFNTKNDGMKRARDTSSSELEQNNGMIGESETSKSELEQNNAKKQKLDDPLLIKQYQDILLKHKIIDSQIYHGIWKAFSSIIKIKESEKKEIQIAYENILLGDNPFKINDYCKEKIYKDWKEKFPEYDFDCEFTRKDGTDFEGSDVYKNILQKHKIINSKTYTFWKKLPGINDEEKKEVEEAYNKIVGNENPFSVTIKCENKINNYWIEKFPGEFECMWFYGSTQNLVEDEYENDRKLLLQHHIVNNLSYTIWLKNVKNKLPEATQTQISNIFSNFIDRKGVKFPDKCINIHYEYWKRNYPDAFNRFIKPHLTDGQKQLYKIKSKKRRSLKKKIRRSKSLKKRIMKSKSFKKKRIMKSKSLKKPKSIKKKIYKSKRYLSSKKKNKN